MKKTVSNIAVNEAVYTPKDFSYGKEWEMEVGPNREREDLTWLIK